MLTLKASRQDLRGYLILVNASHPLLVPAEGLVPVDRRRPDILLQWEAAKALGEALAYIGAGDGIIPVSGYRSRAEQAAIYESSLRENGPAFTKKYVALPGCSEHETGLAIDLGLNRGEIDFLRPDFPYKGICQRFREAAPRFGFIQRYAADKEAVTGIAHEPWHFRYVGRPHAMVMAEKGLALEEYLEMYPSLSGDSGGPAAGRRP